MTGPAIAGYAELHCLSNFTFLRGASHPQELVRRACDLGYAALAITDECSVAGVVRAYSERKHHRHPLKLIIGAQFRPLPKPYPMTPRAPLVWSAAGLIAVLALPWYALQESLDSTAWWWGLW